MFPRGDGAGSHGIVPGLDSMRTVLRRYTASQGALRIPPEGHFVIPLPDLLHFGFTRTATVSFTAAQAANGLAATVPTNERWELTSIRVARTSGDNTILSMFLAYPAGFFLTNSTAYLMELTTAVSKYLWPTGADNEKVLPVAPFILEPGTELYIEASGAGVGASAFAATVSYRATRIIRALRP